MVKEVDPSDIGKYPHLIKKAQMEMSRTDVHVCGKCHTVYHFVELFLKHRQQGCSEESSLRDSKETKPKVWAFLLWKASQLNSDQQGNGDAWKQYQNWIKLEDTVRETWIVAGRTIQSFAKIGQGNLQEMPVKITKTVVDTSVPEPIKKTTPNTTPKAIVTRQVPAKIIQKKNENTSDNDAVSEIAKLDKSPVEQPKVIKKIVPRSPLARIPANPVLLNKGIARCATRTIPNTNETETEEKTIEKILAKRFNPRKKEHEYLVKWDNYSHEDNTWEPHSHLKNCAQLMDTFEKQLARQKEQRALMAARQAAIQSEQEKPEVASPPSLVLPSDSPNRPQRSSKARAMDNVRQWCADNEEMAAASKRKPDDSDYEQTPESEEDEPQPLLQQPPPPKIAKIENTSSAVAQALIKAGQSGNVRIVPVNKPNVIPKVNGIEMKSPDRNSADVVITSPKDGKPTGIVKKPGAIQTPITKNEAQVRVVQKGENTSSGVVRITKANVPAPAPRTVPQKPMTTNITTIRAVTNQQANVPSKTPPVKPIITTRPASASRVFPAASRPSSQIAMKQQTRATSVQQLRTSISPATSPNAPTVAQKSGITRIVKKSPMAMPPTSQTIIQDEKLAALTRHGDLKITRKQVPSTKDVVAPPSIPTKLTVRSDDDDYNMPDPFPTTIITAVPPSPPREMTLCPITGKVLSQAEGEPTPQPSPEPEPEPEEKVVKEPSKKHVEEQHQPMETGDGNETQIHQILTNEDGSPMIVTGEDGTIYQVAGKNEQGQTVLIAQGSDGEQQFVYVASEDDDGNLMTLDSAVSEAVQPGATEQTSEDPNAQQQYIVKQDGGGSDPSQPLTVATDSDSQDGQITAEVIQADLPSPGGTRKVVLLLPDGSFVMTEVSDEQFQSLNLVT